jgi:hypothetical protein
MALCNGRRREGSVNAARLWRVHRSEAESIDGFFPPLPDRCLKRGHLTKEEIWWNFLIGMRLYARRAGRCGAVLTVHRITVEEFISWANRFELMRIDGLRITKIVRAARLALIQGTAVYLIDVVAGW